MTTEGLDTHALREYRLRARSWLAENMSPLPRAADGTVLPAADTDPSAERFAHAREMQAALYDGGFAGITYPTEYGGGGLDLDHERVFFEESTGYDVSTRDFGVSLNILGVTLLHFGSPEQKRKHLPKMLRGEEIWLQLLSEPSGGSDLAGLVTRATRDGDSYILNGQKTWSTGAQFADFAMCPARTNWDVPKHKGISIFIVDLRKPGIEIRPIKQIDGGSEFCEEFLTDVLVSTDDIVGKENDGWAVVRGLLEIEHEWVGRSGAGRAGLPDDSVADLAAILRRRGLTQDVGARRKVSEIRAMQTVHRLLVGRISKGIANGALSPGYGGLLKLGADVVAQRRAETALELGGSSAIAWRRGSDDQNIGNDHLRSRRLSIAGGTTEVQRNNISERVLGLPREPTTDRDVPFTQVLKN